MRPRRKPMFVTLEFDADLVIVHAQVTIGVTNDCLRHHLLHFLRHDADIGAIAAVITEPIVPKAIGEMAKQDDVVFDRDVGSPSAAATAAASTTAEATTATAAEPTTAAGSHAAASAETSAAHARTTACRHVRSSRPHVSYSASPAGRSLRCPGPAARRPLSCDRSASARPLSCTGSAASRKLACTWPLAAAGPLSKTGSASSRKLPYARPLSGTRPQPCSGAVRPVLPVGPAERIHPWPIGDDAGIAPIDAAAPPISA